MSLASKELDLKHRHSLLTEVGVEVPLPPHFIQHLSNINKRPSSLLLNKHRKEKCPLCLQSSLILHPKPTFRCSKCSNREIQQKLSTIDQKKKQIKNQISKIEPILHSHLSMIEIHFGDKIFAEKCKQHRLLFLRKLLQNKSKENKELQSKISSLKKKNKNRASKLIKYEKKMHQIWPQMYDKCIKSNVENEIIFHTRYNISRLLSIQKLLQFTDIFYRMNANSHQKLSIIQNIVLPSAIFSVSEIRSFYAQNDQFSYPMKNMNMKEYVSDHNLHSEHGICTALQHIVCYSLLVSKYLNIHLLFEMAFLHWHNCQQQRSEIIHGAYIMDNEQKKYRLFWNDVNGNEWENEFCFGLKLLEENIRHLCIECNVKSNELFPFEFVTNLITLKNHLRIEEKKCMVEYESNRKQNAQKLQKNQKLSKKKRLKNNTKKHKNNGENQVTSAMLLSTIDENEKGQKTNVVEEDEDFVLL